MEELLTAKEYKKLILKEASEVEVAFKKYIKNVPVFLNIKGKAARKAVSHTISPLVKPQITKAVNHAKKNLNSENTLMDEGQERVWKGLVASYSSILSFIEELNEREEEDFTLLVGHLESEMAIIVALTKELD